MNDNQAKAKLSKAQQFVYDTLVNGGSLLEEEVSGELYFDDADGNTYWVSRATVQVLFNRGLLTIGHRPALGIRRIIPIIQRTKNHQ